MTVLAYVIKLRDNETVRRAEKELCVAENVYLHEPFDRHWGRLASRWLLRRSFVLGNSKTQDVFLDQKIHCVWCLHESLNCGSQCA